MRRLFSAFLIGSLLIVLAACESASERAERHFEQAIAYVEEGDNVRALVELRNVLQLDPAHQEARRTLADTLLAEGRPKQAFAQYRDLTERYPEDGAAHLAAAQLALSFGSWDAVERFGTKAIELLPVSTETRVIQANIDYRDALVDEDMERAATVVAEARALIGEDPAMKDARRIVIDDLVRDEHWIDALEVVDGGLETDPLDLEFNEIRLSVLNQLGRTAEITEQLQSMVANFPEDDRIAMVLMRWHVAQGEMDDAEALLRQRAEATPDDFDRWSTLLRFLSETEGPEAVAQELDQLIARGGDNTILFRAIRSAQKFTEGDRDSAIGELEELLADLPEEEATEGTANDIRVDLARMYLVTGNLVRARDLVETVLQNDPTHVPAMKNLAGWQIDEDQVDNAIVTLRAALREDPDDPEIMTLMAAAHDRAGEPELQREMLALAVEASGNAPDETLRYAAVLAGSERYGPAEDVVIEALRLVPGNQPLLQALGQIYLQTEDWPRIEGVIGALEDLGPEGTRTAAALRAEMLSRRQDDDALIGYLESFAEEDDGLGAEIALLQTYVATGEVEKARERIEALKAEDPDNEVVRFIDAALMASVGQFDTAETEFEAILAENPAASRVWMALYRMKLIQGAPDAAEAVLDRAIAANPENWDLQITQAGAFERAGDIDAAIEIYETLYGRNSNVELVANNLASLLSTYRTDTATLERSYQISRRLQDSDVPAFRETYGWIAARLGRYEEAVEHLAVAAEAYPDLALAQYHYAVALAGAGQTEAALERFRHVATLDLSSLPAEDRAAIDTEIARLEAGDAAAD